MAIRFIDSVSSYGKPSLLERYDSVQTPMRVEYRNWSPRGTIEGSAIPGCAIAGRYAGAALVWSGSYGGFVQKILPASTSDLHILSFNLLFRNAATSPQWSPPTGTRDGVLAALIPGTGPSNRTSLTLGMTDTGGLQVYLGGFVTYTGGNLVLSGGTAQIDVWTQITVELKIGVADGYVKIYQENPTTELMDLVGDTGLINTSQDMYDLNNPVGSVRLSQPATFQGRFDEIFVQDGLTSDNNAFLGRVHVKADTKGVDSGNSDFTDGGGITNSHPGPTTPRNTELKVENGERVGNRSCQMFPDDTLGTHEGDKNFLEGNVSGDKLLLNPPSDLGLLALQVAVVSRKTASDSTQYNFLAYDGSENLAGLESVTSEYKVKSHVFNSDPRDDSTWTSLKVSDFDFGIKKV